jgi:3-oxoacyl-[acyl-carrier protein] reductase
MTQQTGKVALITGASRGIGALLAERLAGDGFTVVVNYAGSAKAAEDVVRKIKAAGGNALTSQADVSNPTAVVRMFDSAESALGGLDAVINCAGILKLAKLADCTDESFDQTIAVNLKGTFNCLREAVKRVRNGGRIVNFSSSVIGLRLETYGVYSATKAAVEAMTAVASREVRGRNITVNAIAPGPVATDLFLEGKSRELIDHMAKMNPLERLGTPEDIANAVRFLLGPRGGWVNGQVLRANGGMN